MRKLPARRKKRTASRITYQMVYEDFVEHYPAASTHIHKWVPCGFLTIRLTFRDMPAMTYNYLTKQAKHVSVD